MADATSVVVDDLIALRARARALRLRRGAQVAPRAMARATFRGRGIDFETSRPYALGDDVRSIDWRVTARRGEPHTKVFREDRDRPLVLLVDLGRSMRFGTRRLFKSVLAARAAALLAWAAVDGGSRLGAVVVGAGGTRELSPRGHAHAALEFFGALETMDARAPASESSLAALNGALARVAASTQSGSVVVVLSDFRDLDGSGKAAIRRLGRFSALTLGIISDPLESTLPFDGDYAFNDAGRRVVLHARGESDRRAYAQHFADRERDVVQIGVDAGARSMPLSTADPDAETAVLLAGIRH